MKRVKILWTGGFDSSFRVSQLSRMDVEIEPYYISKNFRDSEENELNAIKEISDYLRGLDQTKAKILPLNYVDVVDIDDAEDIVEAFDKLVETRYLGRQYLYLSTFAKNHHGIEMSVHDQIIHIFDEYDALIKIHDDVLGDNYILDESKAPDYIVTLFKDYTFPLAKYTKQLMKEEYIEYGLKEVMDKTWFCHSPINGEPCGKCNPCKYTIEEGLYYRFNKRAFIRYALLKCGVYSIRPALRSFFRPKYLKARLNRRRLSYFLKRDLKKLHSSIKDNLKQYSNLNFKQSLKFFAKNIKKHLRNIKNAVGEYIEFFKTH